MPDSQKLILMVQPSRLQGLIWQTVLKSQQLSVIWESPTADLADNLDQIKAAGLTLPDLLLVDMQVPELNPYAFCRWCREQYPGLKLVLTNSNQAAISLSERQWAVNQGASDLLAGFQQDNLVSGVTSSVKRVLEILDGQPLNNGALISVLLAMKRQLEARSATKTTERRMVPVETAIAPGAGKDSRFQSMTTLAEVASTAPLSVTNGNGKAVKVASQNGNGNGTRLRVDDLPADQSKPKANAEVRDRPNATPETGESKGTTDKGKRRYRGLYY